MKLLLFPRFIFHVFSVTFVLRLRPHVTQGTRPPNNFNDLFAIKNIERHVCNAEKVYLRVRGWGSIRFVKLFFILLRKTFLFIILTVKKTLKFLDTRVPCVAWGRNPRIII